MSAFSNVSPDPLDRSRFPVDEWALVEDRFDPEDLGVTESLFAVGNGYLGLRGNYEESRDAFTDGTFVNGFYETWPIHHAEQAFGLASVGQSMIDIPDPKVIRLYVDDEPLHLSKADLIDYQRELNFRTGVLTRTLLWRTPSGKKVRVVTRRMVSFTQKHLAVMTMEVTLLNGRGPLLISSQLINRQDRDQYHPADEAPAGSIADPRKGERFTRRVLVPEVSSINQETGRIRFGYRTAESKMTIGVVADHHLEAPTEVRTEAYIDDDEGKMIYRMQVDAGQTVSLTKMMAVHIAQEVPPRELIDRCERTLDRSEEEGLDRLFAEQRAWLDSYWERSDVEIHGQPALQQAIRWNLFSLAQASARAEAQGIPAKGVTGAGYGGHYFWDGEIYVLPFLTYTSPHIALNALRFRVAMLPAARERAREVSQKGALFPWRTINGKEASAYYAAGTAQYHIDADISYAVSQYVGATDDLDFLFREGIDVLVETARMWEDLGFWRKHNGDSTFHIHSVTGPDEYTTVVNDNMFTNVMARFNLRRAADAVRQVQQEDPPAFEQLVRRTGVTSEEVETWTQAAEHMDIPWDAKVGIHPQDSRFLDREMWDLERTPKSMRPLLLHHHPLVIYRFQVLKQADVVLALFLQNEEFTAAEKLADFEYYDPITTGDSTLSAVTQSIIAAEVGYADLAYQYFLQAIYVDLANLHANTADGVHIASVGGTWTALACGFGGFRDRGDGGWAFDPRLPKQWDRLVYRMTLRGVRFRVEVEQTSITLTTESGGSTLEFSIRGENVVLRPGEPVTVALADQGPVIPGAPKNPAGTVRADGTVISATVPGLD